jgi:cytochrome c553
MVRFPAALLLLLFSATAALADPAPCLECHRRGASGGLAPLLEGQHAEYLRTQLTRFREHLRPSFPMTDLSQGLHEQLIEALAAALAARPWQDFAGRINREAAARGSELAARRDCRSCHGEALRGGDSIPRLAGQSPAYLRRQLEAFAAGDRYHPPTGGGQRMQALSAQQSEDLAYWLASLSAPASAR